MRGIDLIAAFELEIGKIDDAINKPVTDDSIYWLNQGIVKFAKDRFNGNAPKRTSYEQNEKRTRDLIKLLDSIQYDQCVSYEANDTYDVYTYDQIDNIMFILSETVVITDNEDNHPYDTSVFECTADSFMYRITNSLTDFHYRHHKARPLRIRTADGRCLLTDKNYKIKTYRLTYLKKPTEITNDNPETEYTDFADDIWLEIVKIAAQMYIENQGDPRYKTLTQEVLTQE